MTKLPTLKTGDPIVIEWVDITGIREWKETSQVKDETPAIIVTRGIFISCKKRLLKVASTYWKNYEQVSDINIIPLSVVSSIKVDAN